MPVPIPDELRTQILQSIKDGTTIAQAAETHNIQARTIVHWMRKTTNNSHTSVSELSKAKKEIEFLRSVILDLILEQKALIRKG